MYIIGNDGITLCREAASSMTERLQSRRKQNCTLRRLARELLALWNALPGVEERSKIDDRAA